MAPYRWLADAVLLLHLTVVVFVVAGPLLFVLGHRWGWPLVNTLRFRVAHGLTLGFVIVQAWLGQWCPLTLLENWLREQGGERSYGTGFVEHWVGRVLFYQAPVWVFTAAYTAFGLLVLVVWWRVPLQPQPLRSRLRPC